MAMMVVSVAAANPEMVEDFTMRIASIIRVDKYRMDITTEDGERVMVFSTPDASVENRNGRAILVIDDRDVADITDALAKEGRYEYDEVTEKTQMHIEVEGTAEKWTASISLDVPGGRTPYTFSQDSEGNGSSSAPAFSGPDDGENPWASAYEYDGETVAPSPRRSESRAKQKLPGSAGALSYIHRTTRYIMIKWATLPSRMNTWKIS